MAQVMTLGQQIAWTDWSYAKAKGNLFNDAFMKFHPEIVEMNSKLAGGKISYYKEQPRVQFKQFGGCSPLSNPFFYAWAFVE